MTVLSVAELKNEVAPRISGLDLMDLVNSKVSRRKVMIVDVREAEEYP